MAAMQEAAGRDRIAYQYANSFDDIFVTGLLTLAEADQAGLQAPLRAVLVYLAFLDAWPDTHICRKFGRETAAAVQKEAGSMLALFRAEHGDCLPALLAFDKELKARHLNPGTSADLTVATLFAARLHDGLPIRRNDG
jgi:triphosphoribosyl-dephospho-CoA synthase